MSEEIKKLRGACIHYLLTRGKDYKRTVALTTIELLRDTSIAYLEAEGVKGAVVSYHFEGDTK